MKKGVLISVLIIIVLLFFGGYYFVYDMKRVQEAPVISVDPIVQSICLGKFRSEIALCGKPAERCCSQRAQAQLELCYGRSAQYVQSLFDTDCVQLIA